MLSTFLQVQLHQTLLDPVDGSDPFRARAVQYQGRLTRPNPQDDGGMVGFGAVEDQNRIGADADVSEKAMHSGQSDRSAKWRNEIRDRY